jgi:hypothetical protein
MYIINQNLQQLPAFLPIAKARGSSRLFVEFQVQKIAGIPLPE